MLMFDHGRFPVNLDTRQNLITTSALDKHSLEFYVISGNPSTGCPDALITSSRLEAKAGIKHLKSNSVKKCSFNVISHSHSVVLWTVISHNFHSVRE